MGENHSSLGGGKKTTNRTLYSSYREVGRIERGKESGTRRAKKDGKWREVWERRQTN